MPVPRVEVHDRGACHQRSGECAAAHVCDAVRQQRTDDLDMTYNLRTSLRIVLFLSLWVVVTSAASGPWRFGQAEVSVKCPMTVGGSFDAKTTALTGTLTASAGRPS